MDIYSSVEDWNDLIETNLLFLSGEIEETFYHGGKLNSETTYFLNDIIELNKKGLFTYTSQPYVYNKQRSYLSFHCERKLIKKLLNKLKENKKIYFSCRTDDEYIDNIKQDRLNLSRKKRRGKWIRYTNWWKSHCSETPELESLAQDDYPNVHELLEDTASFEVIANNFKEDVSIPNIVLNYMNIIENENI